MEENQQTPIDHGNRYATWTYPEYEEFSRSVRWYVIMGILLLALVFYGIWSKNYLFAVFLVLAAFLYLFRFRNKPRLITFSITEDGLEVHESFHPYKDLKKFWIVYDPPEVKRLYLEFKKGLQPVLSIPLETQNPVKIREILLEKIAEDVEKDEELLSDLLQRKIKL